MVVQDRRRQLAFRVPLAIAVAIVCSARKNTRPPIPMILPISSSEPIRNANVSGRASTRRGRSVAISNGARAKLVTIAMNKRT